MSGEQTLPVAVRVVDPLDLPMLGVWAYFLSKYSWGWDYPITPLSEIRKADYIVGAFSENQPVGFACVNRLASPDREGNGQFWFSSWVVVPEFRSRKIGARLYDECLKYMHSPERKERIFLSTENKSIMDAFIRRGWTIIRDNALNEAGAPTTIFELCRPP